MPPTVSGKEPRPTTPARSPEQLRARLRELRDRIRSIEDHRRQLRLEQLEHARTALKNGATITTITEATGLSRAYLHREGLRSGDYRLSASDAESAARSAALEHAARIRDELGGADRGALDAASSEKDERRQIIAALLEVNPPTSQKDLADDAGVSKEWIRRLAKRAH